MTLELCSLTLCRWFCSFSLASAVSLILVLNELLTVLNWLHIALAVALRHWSISPLILSDADLSRWERAMLLRVNFTHESGVLNLVEE